MDTLQTLIHFVNSTPSPFGPDGPVGPGSSGLSGAAKTGDMLLWLVIIAAIIFVVSFVVQRLSKNNKINLSGAMAKATNIVSIAAIVVCLVSCLFLGFLSFTNTANAEDNGSVTTSVKVDAQVNAKDGTINIANGFIKNETNRDYYLTSIAVTDNTEGKVANSTWTIKNGDDVLYKDKATSQKHEFPNPFYLKAGEIKDISFEVSDLPMDQAISLCDTDVVKTSYDVLEIARVEDMKVNDKVNPIDIDTKSPQFSWKINSKVVGQEQTFYQIIVKDASGNIVKDTGKVKSSESSVKLENLDLKSSSNYTWQLTAYDKFGYAMATGEATFGTAMFEGMAGDFIAYRDPRLDGERNTTVYTLEDDFVIHTGTTNICFGATDNKTYTQVKFYIDNGVHKLSLIKVEPGQPVKEYFNEPVDIDQWTDAKHHLKIDVNGTALTIFVDGKQLKQTTIDQTPLNKLAFVTDMNANDSNVSYVTNIVAKDAEGNEIFKKDFTDGNLGFVHELSACVEHNDLFEANALKLGTYKSGAFAPEQLIESNDKDNLPVFRKAFSVDKEVASAKLYATSLGVNTTYLNGEKVGNYELEPGFTESSKHLYYTTYDVTDKITQGQNAVSAVVGSGWWSAVVARWAGPTEAYKANLVITYKDGSIETIKTDTSWKTDTASAITYSDIFGGESFDANTNEAWKDAGFDDTSWINTVANNDFKGTLESWKSSHVVIRPDLERAAQTATLYDGATGADVDRHGKINVIKQYDKPQSVSLDSGQTLLVDVGQNATGWENFDISGEKGAVVTIKHSEILNDKEGQFNRSNDGPGGSAYFKNLRGAKATTHFTLGDSATSYHPTSTFYGFRYLEFTTTKKVTLSNISASTVTSVEKDNGKISTNSDDINQLISNSTWGMYSNYLSIATDCPQRDERQGWTADAQVFSETGCFLGQNKAFLEKYCTDLVESARDNAFAGTAPTGAYNGIAYGGTGWADAGVIIPYTLFKMYGDTAVVDKCWDAMDKYVMTYIPTCCTPNHHGPLNHWGDWLAPGDNTNDDEVRTILASCYYCWDLKMLAEMAQAKGEPTKPYLDKLNEEKAWFVENYYTNNNNELKRNEVQSICLYALYLDLLPEGEARLKVLSNLMDNFSKSEDKLQTGFLGTKIILDALVKEGQYQQAFRTLKTNDYPSWLYSVKNGATTIWERWNSYTEDKGMGDDGMNSFNHYAYGAVVSSMFHSLAGINTLESSPGFKNITLTPFPDKELSPVKSHFETNYGMLNIESNYTDDNWTYSFNVPANSTATLKIPKIGFSGIEVNGKALRSLKLDTDGIQLKSQDDKNFVFDVVAGQYNVVSSNTVDNVEIKGTVLSDTQFNSASVPIKDVKVSAVSETGKTIAECKTNEEGNYSMQVAYGTKAKVIFFKDGLTLKSSGFMIMEGDQKIDASMYYDLAIRNLKTDGMVNPAGTDNKKPKFEWQLYSTLTGQNQTAYQVQVWHGGEQIWNSGKVESDQQKDVEYNGKDLESSKDYTWQVTLWDKNNIEKKSDIAKFSTALLEDNPLSDAKFIMHENAAEIQKDPRDVSNYTISWEPIINNGVDMWLAFSCLSNNTYTVWKFEAENDKLVLTPQQVTNGNIYKWPTIDITGKVPFSQDRRHAKVVVEGTKVTTYVDDVMVDDTFNFSEPKPLARLMLFNLSPEDAKPSIEGFDVHPFKNVGGSLFMDDYSFLRPILPVYRNTFDITGKEVASAKLYTTGLGNYETYINGQRVGNKLDDGSIEYYELQPGFTEYFAGQQRVLYSENDVTWMLGNNTKNAISAVVTNGWWLGGAGGQQDFDGYKRYNTAYKAKLVVSYKDGSTDTIVTNEDWKSSIASAVTMGDIFGGESYDARIDQSWKNSNFEEDKSWKPVVENTEFNGKISFNKGAQIKVRNDLERKPVYSITYQGRKDVIPNVQHGVIDNVVEQGDVIHLQPGQTAQIDFGQNAAGRELFTAYADAGTTITVKHSEILNDHNGEVSRNNDGPGGSAYLANMRGAPATTTYVTNGNKPETYHPTFTYYGFRYIVITADKPVTLTNIKAQTLTSAVKDTGTIKTNNDDINRMVQNSRWSLYSNYFSVPTDCPQRDERQGWMGDTQVYAETGCLLNDSKTFLEKFCVDMMDSQSKDNSYSSPSHAKGAYASTSPRGLYRGGGGGCEDTYWGATGWSDCGIILPYTLYTMYNDKNVINTNWDSMVAYMNYVENYSKNHNNNNGAYNCWGDWLAFEDGEGHGEISQTVLGRSYFATNAKMMAEMAKATGRTAEFNTYDKLYEKIKADYINDVINTDLYNKLTTQTGCAYTLYAGLYDSESRKEEIVQRLLSNIEKQGNKLATGFMGTKILLDTLTMTGNNDVAYKLLLQTNYPSWLYPVLQGATTIWERWDSYTLEKGFQSMGMNSFNHYAYGSVVAWMYHTMAGIKYDANNPGYKNIIMNPVPDMNKNGIKDVYATYDCATGKISVESHLTDTQWKYDFVIPAGSTATLTLPDIVFKHFTINGKEIKDLNLENDGVELQDNSLSIQSGIYELVAN